LLSHSLFYYRYCLSHWLCKCENAKKYIWLHGWWLGLLLCIQEILGLNNLNPESSCPDLTFYQCHNFHTTGINVLKL
jgi:hypothetical protein